MPLFDKKPQLSKGEFKDILKKTEGAGRLRPQERIRMAEDVFGKKYGEFISPADYQRAINDLRRQTMQARDFQERTKLHKTIKYLEDLKKRP